MFILDDRFHFAKRQERHIGFVQHFQKDLLGHVRFQVPRKTRLSRGIAILESIAQKEFLGQATNDAFRATSNVGLSQAARTNSANVLALTQECYYGKSPPCYKLKDIFLGMQT